MHGSLNPPPAYHMLPLAPGAGVAVAVDALRGQGYLECLEVSLADLVLQPWDSLDGSGVDLVGRQIRG
jgi:hypothetical protein